LRHADTGNRLASDVATSLNVIFDRLARENHLKGRSPKDWGHSVSTYIYELGTIQPFLIGNEIVLREFADELARKNNLSLQWDTASEIDANPVMRHLDQSEQSANIRRMVMLAMDTDSGSLRPSRGTVVERGIERLFAAGTPLP
jgi:fido (protein-threonine AMPylation protein)